MDSVQSLQCVWTLWVPCSSWRAFHADSWGYRRLTYGLIEGWAGPGLAIVRLLWLIPLHVVGVQDRKQGSPSFGSTSILRRAQSRTWASMLCINFDNVNSACVCIWRLVADHQAAPAGRCTDLVPVSEHTLSFTVSGWLSIDRCRYRQNYLLRPRQGAV